MIRTIDISPISREHKWLWLGARFLYLLIVYPLFMVLVVQTWNPVVDNLVFYAGPFVLLTAFLVAFFVAGRFVANWGKAAAFTFALFLVINAVVLYDKILPSLRDLSFFDLSDVITNLAYLASLLLVARASIAGWRLAGALVPASQVSLHEVLAATSKHRNTRVLGASRFVFKANVRGWTTFVASAAVVAIGAWLFVADRALLIVRLEDATPGDLHRFINLLGFVIVSLLGVLLGRDGLRRIRADAQVKMLADTRPPILLLRSFTDDAASIPAIGLLTWLQGRRVRLEEAIAHQLARKGPFVTVSAPGEELPELGAFRAYFSNESWQQAVFHLIGESCAVIMVVGLTGWVQWELRAIREAQALAKLILLLPPGTLDDRHSRWRLVCDCLRGSPWYEALITVKIENALCVCFEEGGSIAVFEGAKRSECDYGLAIRFGLFQSFSDAPRLL